MLVIPPQSLWIDYTSSSIKLLGLALFTWQLFSICFQHPTEQKEIPSLPPSSDTGTPKKERQVIYHTSTLGGENFQLRTMNLKTSNQGQQEKNIEHFTGISLHGLTCQCKTKRLRRITPDIRFRLQVYGEPCVNQMGDVRPTDAKNGLSGFI